MLFYLGAISGKALLGFGSSYPLQALTTLRFTTLRSGLSASIRSLDPALAGHPFGG
jgi:hypothetical protein